MTDEEMAEEWVSENGFGSDCNNINSVEANREMVNAFLAGLKADELNNKIAELEAQIEKMKQDLDRARENANRQEQWEIYSVLNDIYNNNFEVITSVSN